MKVDKKSMLLYAVTDRTWLNDNDHLAIKVEDAIKAGVTFVQLREKNLGVEEFIEEAKKIKVVTDRYNVPFIINDNIDVAIAANVDGVHIGQDDENIKDARKRLGEDKIIGLSAHNVREAIEAERLGADYIGVGAVFNTSTKLDVSTVTFDVLKKICESVSIPVVAIGGINKDNILKLAGSGVDGVAVVSALFAQSDISKAAEVLLQLSKKMVTK